MEYVLIIISAIFVNNVVLAQFLGICPFLGVSNKVQTALGMAGAVTFVIVLATMVTYIIHTYVLIPLHIEFMQTITFILVIAALVQLVEIILKKYIPSLHASLGVYLPLITTNCAVLGVTILNISTKYDFISSMVNSFGSGLGFFLAMVLFSGVRSRMEGADTPKAFEGLPITLVAASIVSVSFFGFAGVVDNLFK